MTISPLFDPSAWREVPGFSFTDITYHRAVDQGTVRIPIDEAMRLTVERGLPVRPGGNADGLNMVVQDSSSGRTAAPR